MPIPNAITAATLKMRFPVFRNADDAMLEFCIEEASLWVDPDIWGDYYLMGLLYGAAHIAMRARQTLSGGSGQLLRSVSMGGEISYSYESVPPPTLADGTDLATTPFGLRYLDYVRLVQPAVAII